MRYDEEWKRKVSEGVKRFWNNSGTVPEETKRKLSEAGKKGNKVRVYKHIPMEELKCSKSVRERLFKERGRKCELCGWAVPNPYNGIIPVQVDHLDGNVNNNDPANLMIKCPNCHSLSEFFMFYGRSHKGTFGKKGTNRDRTTEQKERYSHNRQIKRAHVNNTK